MEEIGYCCVQIIKLWFSILLLGHVVKQKMSVNIMLMNQEINNFDYLRMKETHTNFFPVVEAGNF